MKLPDILALHPGPDASAPALAAAVGTAAEKRAALLRQIGEADQLRADGLLTADDKALLAAEKDAAQARLAVERIDAILPRLRADLERQQGVETVARLHAAVVAYRAGPLAEMERWYSDCYQAIAEGIGAGLVAEHRVATAYAELVAEIGAAFNSQAVRDAAPDGIDPGQPSGQRPSVLFLNWGHPGHG